jgi:Leucine-rich repeat (LRR) protein
MADNFVFQTIPDEIGSLGNLESLDLSRNLLTGSLPYQLRDLTRLSSFRLSNNFLKGNVIDPLDRNGFILPPLYLRDSLLELDLSSNFLTGTLPYKIVTLSSLESLNLSSNAFTGAIPEGISLLNHLSTLGLAGNSFTGSIPNGISLLTNLISLGLSTKLPNFLSLPTTWEFLSSMTKLESLDLSRNYVGFFPTQITNLTNLEDLNLSYNSITGSIPPEIALLTNLKRLDLNVNSFTGSIPTEIGLMTNVEDLYLERNSFTGSIPTEIGLMTNVEYLYLFYNSFTGFIPTEIGLMTNAESLDLGHNSFTGSIPTEIGLMTNAEYLVLESNLFTGSVPNAVCDVVANVYVDCGEVQCGCCRCPTPSPTSSPSTSSSPSISLLPTTSPSTSWLPSISSAPSSEFSCSSFVSIASTGQVLSNISNTDDGAESVNLPFVFIWRGLVNYTQVEVHSNGAVFPGGDRSNAYSYGAFPVKLGIGYSVPRIAAWQQDLNPSIAGNIYGANVDGVFVISWEGVPQHGGLPENGVNFQVALHPGGNIEIRWGDGNPPTNRDTRGASGIEDDTVGMAVPATRFPFGDETNGGVSATFPSNQCRIFVVSTVMGIYTEWLWT